MAAKRQDRLLERQRGAGTRQIKNTGFDLLLPGQENVINTPFQLQKSGRPRKTPQPELKPQKSGRSRKTPQPELLQRSTRRTPVPEESGQQSSSGKTPASVNPRKRGRPKALLDINEEAPTRDDEGEVPVKKRRVNRAPRSKKAADNAKFSDDIYASEVQVKDSLTTEPDQKSLPAPGVKKRKKRKSIGQQSIRKTRSSGQSPLKLAPGPRKRGRKPKDAQLIQPVTYGTPEPPEYSRITTPAIQDREQSHLPASIDPINGGTEDVLLNGHVEKEVEEAGLTTKKRKRNAIARKSKQRAEPMFTKDSLVEGALVDEATTEQAQENPRKRRKPGHKKKLSAELARSGESTDERSAGVTQPMKAIADDLGEVFAPAPSHQTVIDQETNPAKERKPRRKKRKSIGQQSMRHNRKSKDSTTPTRKTTKKASADTPVSSVADTSFQPASPQIPTPIHEEAAYGIDHISGHEEAQPELVEPKKKRGRPRKADAAAAPPNQPPSTKPSQSRTKKPKSTKPSTPKPRNPPKNTIPITYYVPLSPTSPTAPDASESDAMDDPLSNPLPKLSAPKNINAIDVLSQVTLEIISKTSAQLAQKAEDDPTQRAHYKRQQEIVSTYGEELEARLFQLTNTLNENTSLAACARKQAAEERKLKKDIKQLNTEREEIRVRKEARVKEKKGRKLEKMLNGIGEVVKKGWEMEARRKEEGAEE